jgi:hypothetical protein
MLDALTRYVLARRRDGITYKGLDRELGTAPRFCEARIRVAFQYFDARNVTEAVVRAIGAGYISGYGPAGGIVAPYLDPTVAEARREYLSWCNLPRTKPTSRAKLSTPDLVTQAMVTLAEKQGCPVETVLVPKALLTEVLDTAQSNSECHEHDRCCTVQERASSANERQQIDMLREAAGIQ